MCVVVRDGVVLGSPSGDTIRVCHGLEALPLRHGRMLKLSEARRFPRSRCNTGFRDQENQTLVTSFVARFKMLHSLALRARSIIPNSVKYLRSS